MASKKERSFTPRSQFVNKQAKLTTNKANSRIVIVISRLLVFSITSFHNFIFRRNRKKKNVRSISEGNISMIKYFNLMKEIRIFSTTK